MPKEVISSVPGRALIFKWGRETNGGQLGIEFGDDWFSFHSDAVDINGTAPEYNSLWVDFETREDYNRAIKILRKMRDAQFGRDE